MIDQRGNIVSTIEWDKKSCLISEQQIKNFYSKYGDYIGRLACFIAVILIYVIC